MQICNCRWWFSNQEMSHCCGLNSTSQVQTKAFCCDMLCLDQPSLSSKWPWTKSNSLLLPRVRFDIHALSLNIQISRSCSNRLCLNLPREFRYCNGSEFEFPSWINKPLFGSKAIVSRYPFMDIWDTKQRALSLNLTSFSWYGVKYIYIHIYISSKIYPTTKHFFVLERK